MNLDGVVSPEIVSVRNFGIADLQTPHPRVDLGTISSPSPSWQPVSLADAAGNPIAWETVLDAPDFVATRLDSGNLQLAGNPNADYGLRQGIVHVALGSSLQTTVAIQVRAIVQGDISPSADLVSFGLVQTGSPAAQQIVLRATDSKPIVASSIQASRVHANSTLTLSACPNNEAGCAILTVQIGPDQPAGRIVGELRLAFKDRPHTLRLPVAGMLVKASDRITRLDVANNVLDTTRKPFDLARALVASRASPPESINRSGPLLAWQMANDSHLHGYLVARAEGHDGIYQPVDRSIPLSANGAYQWRDASALTDQHYWYRIFAVHLDGHLQALGEPREIATRQTHP